MAEMNLSGRVFLDDDASFGCRAVPIAPGLEITPTQSWG